MQISIPLPSILRWALSLVMVGLLVLFLSDMVGGLATPERYYFGANAVGFKYRSRDLFVLVSSASVLLMIVGLALPRFLSRSWALALQVLLIIAVVELSSH